MPSSIPHDAESNHDEDTGGAGHREAADGGPDAAQEAGNGNSTWKTALGLLVVWGALMGVFTANGMSDAKIEPVRSRSQAQDGPSRPEYRMASHQWLTAPYMIRFPAASTANALKMLGTYRNLRIDEDSLAILGHSNEESRNIRFDEIPLYQILHKIVENDKIGFVLDRNRLRLIAQTLDLRQREGQVWRVQWEADLELTDRKIIVSPTGDLDLLLMLKLEDPTADNPNSWETLAVEFWRGDRWMAMGRANLYAEQAELSLQTTERMRLTIQRTRNATATIPALFRINVNWTDTTNVSREP